MNSIVKFSELEKRFDSEYYAPEYLEKERNLRNCKYDLCPISSIAEVLTDGAHQTPTYVEDGIMFLSSGNIRDLQLDLTDTKSISQQAHKDLARTQVRAGDVLIAKSGRIGTAAVAPKDIDECNLYEGVALLRTSADIDPYYIAAFLNSEYGQYQITRSKKGVSQPHLHLEEIEEIRIPLLSKSFQSSVQDRIKKSHHAQIKSKNLLIEAEKELLNILGVPKSFKQHLTYVSKFSDISVDTRLDSKYYQPKYKKLIKCMEKEGHELETISESSILQLSDKKIDPTDSPTKSYRYITIGNVDPDSGIIVEHNDILGHEAPNRARMSINKSDILIPYLRDSKDSVAIVTDEYDGAVATTGFYVIKSIDALPEFIFALMRSPVIQLQMDQQESGVRLTSVNKKSFKKIQIPKVKKSDQEKIADIINKSFIKREKSRNLVKQIKSEITKKLK